MLSRSVAYTHNYLLKRQFCGNTLGILFNVNKLRTFCYLLSNYIFQLAYLLICSLNIWNSFQPNVQLRRWHVLCFSHQAVNTFSQDHLSFSVNSVSVFSFCDLVRLLTNIHRLYLLWEDGGFLFSFLPFFLSSHQITPGNHLTVITTPPRGQGSNWTLYTSGKCLVPDLCPSNVMSTQ